MPPRLGPGLPEPDAWSIAVSSDNTFFAVLGALSAAGGAAILLLDTPFSQAAGWFGVVSGAGLLLALVYRLIRRR